jgi:hypothetical protein
MFAMSILTVGVMAAFSSQVGSMELMRSSRETQTASADLRAAMEDLLTRTPEFLVEHPESPYLPDQSIEAFEDLHLTGQTIVTRYPNYTVGGVVPPILQIALECTWVDYEGRERDLQLVTALSQ